MLNSCINYCVRIVALIHIINHVIVKQITCNYELFYIDRRIVELLKERRGGFD